MSYTHSITSKGQITIPKEFRERLGLDKLRQATLSLNNAGEVVLTAPKSLEDVRTLLSVPSYKDVLSEKEKIIASHLAEKYSV